MTLDYRSLHVHRWMLRDTPRLLAFQRAIRATVRPGMVVLDVGAGSGVLSLLAAQAGAARVYAVECTPVARLARRLVQANGFGGVVSVIEADLADVQLPEPVDLIVSEWLGTIGIDENLLFPVLLARDRWLKPGGTLLPQRVRARLAPARLATDCTLGYFLQRPFGLDLSPLAEASVHDLLGRRHAVQPGDLLAASQTLWETELASLPLQQALAPQVGEAVFEITRDGEAHTLVGWFEAELAPEVTLSNAPAAPATHWGQLTLPLQRALPLRAGARLHVRVACLPRSPGLADLAWAVRTGDTPWLSHDTRALQPPTPGEPTMPRPLGDESAPEPAEFATSARPPTPAVEEPAGEPADAAAPDAAPMPPAALPSPAEAAPLTRFLARLAVDVDLLTRVIRDPLAEFAAAGLAAADIAALTSRQAAPIELAMTSRGPA